MNSDTTDNDGNFRCCESRQAIDAKLDELKSELMSVFPQPYSMFRNVECHLGCTNDQKEDVLDVDRILAEMIMFDKGDETHLRPGIDEFEV
jgi:hypothetical protein